MQKLTEHYQQLLGFPAIWKVDDVNLSISGLKIEVHLRFVGDEVVCPQCGEHGKAYDKAPEQRWRHLDTGICQQRCRRFIKKIIQLYPGLRLLPGSHSIA